MAENNHHKAPTIDKIRQARKQLGNKVRYTPAWKWDSIAKQQHLGKNTEVFMKLELFQYAGSFKPRGALLNMMKMNKGERNKGVTAVSAGNHAIAVSYAAREMNTSAKVVMPKSTDRSRLDACSSYGAEILLADDVHHAFDLAEEIEKNEGRTFIHPFEGKTTATGTATVGLEFYEQVPDLEAVVIPIGGGGLCAGIASAMKQLNPGIEVYGVEPEGADTMHRSFKSGKPEAIERVTTIATSLGAPHAAPYSFSLCRQYVDDLVLVSDSELAKTMELMFSDMKLVLEPAAASATAALLGPLNERLQGKKVGIIVCGSNTTLDTFYNNIKTHGYD